MAKKGPSLLLFYIVLAGYLLSLYIYPPFQSYKVVERTTINSIYEFLDEPKDSHCNTLIIFDIDNTLLEPQVENNPNQLTSDQWFYKFAQYLMDTYDMPFDQATEILKLINYDLYKNIKLKLVEPHTDKVIKDLQDKGYTVIALTARNCYIIDITLDQLNSNNIDFTRSYDCEHDFRLYVEYPACFKHGVIFSESNDKGQILEKWIYKVKKPFTKIIFIDDKLKNIKHIQREAEKLHIPFIGIRYSYLDEKVKNYRFQPPTEKYLEPFLQRIQYAH